MKQNKPAKKEDWGKLFYSFSSNGSLVSIGGERVSKSKRERDREEEKESNLLFSHDHFIDHHLHLIQFCTYCLSLSRFTSLLDVKYPQYNKTSLCRHMHAIIIIKWKLWHKFMSMTHIYVMVEFIKS